MRAFDPRDEKPRAIRLFTPKAGTSFRGTLPPEDGWTEGSRQVRRRAIFALEFRAISRFLIPRRTRRKIAFESMHKKYRAASDGLKEQGDAKAEA